MSPWREFGAHCHQETFRALDDTPHLVLLNALPHLILLRSSTESACSCGFSPFLWNDPGKREGKKGGGRREEGRGKRKKGEEVKEGRMKREERGG